MNTQRKPCKALESLATGDQLTVSGRITSVRKMRNALFADIRDQSGTVQVCLQRDTHGSSYESAADSLRMGAIVTVSGDVFLTRTQHKSLSVGEYVVHAQCTEPLPDFHHDLTRRLAYDNRGLDLLANTDSLARFIKINRVVSTLRSFLYEEGFQEVDTGILKKVNDTSAARDFVSRSHFLDRDLYLRKSMEMRHKQLLVGGMENIFELGKNFRNESISVEFHPEFTALELYQTFATYRDILSLTRRLLGRLNDVVGEPASKPLEAEEVQLYEFIHDRTGVDARVASASELEAHIPANSRKEYGTHPAFKGFIAYDLFKHLVDTQLADRNVILHGVPKVISVLGKTFDEEPDLVEEFRYFVRGRTFCYGMTELTDAQEQKKRILSQAKYLGKDMTDHDDQFFNVLRFGLPPCAGLGLGLERLLMIYAEQPSIRDVLYFPL